MSKKILYPTGSAIEQLCVNLKLSEPDQFEQDWEYTIVHEIDEQRIIDMLDYYHAKNLNNEVKFTLMVLMIGYCDDRIIERNFDENLWKRIEDILISEKELHLPTIEYWSSLDVDLKDAWSIAPLMRELLRK